MQHKHHGGGGGTTAAQILAVSKPPQDRLLQLAAAAAALKVFYHPLSFANQRDTNANRYCTKDADLALSQALLQSVGPSLYRLHNNVRRAESTTVVL